MAKNAFVYDTATTSWVPMATQLPNVPYAQTSGSGSVTTTTSVTFSSSPFTSTPVILAQLTSDSPATLAITAKSSSGFTVKVTGNTGAVNFDWTAIQQSA
jgi:hypothetical protein